MAFSEGTAFQLYVTHVEGEGPNLKMFGQVDKQRAILIETVLSKSKDNLDNGLGQASPASIHLGMLCVAKYGDGDYYRAKITNVADIGSGVVSVYFIDYGNNDVVHINSIRVLSSFPEMFATTPPQARDFLLARVAHPKGVWDSTMQSSLHKLIYYEEISCIIELVAFEKCFIKMIHNGQDLSEFLTTRGFGVKTTVEEQRNLLYKVLSSSKALHHEVNRMYIPPPARLAVGDVGANNRDAYRGYVPPQSQTTMDVGRTVGKYQQQGRPKVRTVVAPRPLHRSLEETPAATYVDKSLSDVPQASQSPSPTTYHSRHLKENDSYIVHVSYAKDGPKCFAIQLKSDEEFLSNIVSKINSVPPQALAGPPMIGSVCLGRFSEDKTLCRAVVLSTTESYCKLFFVDFGITENVLYSDIFQISESDIIPHVFALRFSLSGIAKMQVTEKIKNDFYQIVNNQVLTLKVVPAEGPPLIQYCELYLNGQCVKEMLLQKQNPSFRKIDVMTITGENLVLVSYVDSCTKFYIQLSKNIDELNEVMDKVAAHCQESQPLLYHQVRCGMSCCAIFPDDQGWYRALVTNIKKDKITVNYVDYGNEQELTCDMLRPITPELVAMKAQAVHCALKGFEDKAFDQRTCDSLEKLTLEKILSMFVHGVMEGGVLLVDLSDESTNPATHIATAVHQAIMASPSTAIQQTPFASTPQESFEVDAASTTHAAGYFPNELVESPKDNVSDTSFGSNRGNNDSFSGRPKKQFQDRERGDRNRNDRAPARGNRDDRKRDFGEKANKRYTKGNVTDKHSGPQSHNIPESKSQSYRLNRKSFSDNMGTSHGVIKTQYHHQRDGKPDRFDRNQRSDGGRRYSDRSSDKEYGGEKRSYGGDQQNKPYKPRNYEPQEPPKTLVNPVAFDTPFSEQSIILGQEYDVRVTWFINPNDFYISIISEEDHFRNMMFNVPTLYTGVKPAFSHEVHLGSSVLARFPEDKALYRAQVMDSQFGGKFKVQFIDYGNKCMVDGSDIWQLENDLMSVPKMAVHCSLKGISPVDKEWKPNYMIDDCFSLPLYKVTFHSKDNDRYFVSLVNDEPGDVGQTLIQKQFAISTEQSTAPSMPTAKVYITHVDTPGQFWLQSESDSDKIDALQEILQNAATFDDYSDREVGKLCISKYSADEQYYRTVILDSDNDIITVRFIDYGNTDVLDNTPDVLKCLPPEMHDIEPYALKCSVNATPTGTGQWTEQASELFTKLLGKTEEPVDAVYILKGATTYVDLFVNSVNVTDQLVSQGQAVKSEKSDQMPTCFASHINSPSEFWIQLESSVHDLEAISEELVNAEEFAPLSEISEEVICAAKFPEDDLWYRAQVVIHGSDGTEVLFMDYGNASLTNDVRSLPDNLKVLPALSRKCALQKPANIKNWSQEAELKFVELAADGATVFYVSFIASGDTSIVELYVDGKSVTEQLSSLCQPEVSTPTCSPTRLPVIGGDDTSLPVYVCHSNSPEDFWIHYGSSTDNLNFIMSALENAANFNTLENIVEGTICASVFPEDNLYYRSKVICHGESGTEVLHIDYGSTAAITDELKELPKELSEIPALARHCSLQIPHDRSKMNEEIHKKFADLVVDDTAEYTIETVNAETDPMIVKLFINNKDIAEILNFEYDNDASNVIVENNVNIDSCSEVKVENEQNYSEMINVVSDDNIVTQLTSTHITETTSYCVDGSEGVMINSDITEVTSVQSENKIQEHVEEKLMNSDGVTESESTNNGDVFDSQENGAPEEISQESNVSARMPENPIEDHEEEMTTNYETVISYTSDNGTIALQENNISDNGNVVLEECNTSEKILQESNVNVEETDNSKQSVREEEKVNIDKTSTAKVDNNIIVCNEPENDAGLNEVDCENITDDDTSNEQPVEMYEDEDRYSDISASEPIDPAEEIKACLDACDKLNKTNGDGDNHNESDVREINKSLDNKITSKDDLQNDNSLSDEKHADVKTSDTEPKMSKDEKCVENNNSLVTE